MTDVVNSFVRQVGSRSWSAKPIVGRRRREKNLDDWSLLLAAASDWASIRGLPKGSGQGSRGTATIIILGRTPGVLEDIFCDCLWRLINDLTIFLTLDSNRRIPFRIGEVSDP